MNKKDLFLKMLGYTPHVLLIGIGVVTIKMGNDARKLRKELNKTKSELALTDVLLLSQMSETERCQKQLSKIKAENQELKSNLAVKKK